MSDDNGISSETKGLIFLVVAILVAGLLFALLPEWLIYWDRNAGYLGKREAAPILEYRGVVVQVVGGFIVAVGLYLTYRRIAATERQADAAMQQVDAAMQQADAARQKTESDAASPLVPAPPTPKMVAPRPSLGL